MHMGLFDLDGEGHDGLVLIDLSHSLYRAVFISCMHVALPSFLESSIK